MLVNIAVQDEESRVAAYYMRLEILWITSIIVYGLDSDDAPELTYQLWYQNPSDLINRIPSSLFDLLALMMESGTSLEYKEQALSVITNIVVDKDSLATTVLQKMPNLLATISDIIDHCQRLPNVVLLTIMECFEVVAKHSSIDQLHYIASVLMVCIRVDTHPSDPIRLITMRLFKVLSDTQSEQLLALLTAGNTIEVLMDAWTKSLGADPNLESCYLRTLCNIASSSIDEIQVKLVNRNVVSVLGTCATHDLQWTQVEALWGLSNIACHSEFTAGVLIADDAVLNNVIMKL